MAQSQHRSAAPVVAVLAHTLVVCAALAMLVYPSGVGFAFFLGTPAWLGMLGALGITLAAAVAALQVELETSGKNLTWVQKARSRHWVGCNALLCVVALLDCLGATQLCWQRFGGAIAQVRAAERVILEDSGGLEAELESVREDRREHERNAVALNTDGISGNDDEAARQSLLAQAAREREAEIQLEIRAQRVKRGEAVAEAGKVQSGAHIVALWLVDAAESGNLAVWGLLILFFYTLEWGLGGRIVHVYMLWRVRVGGGGDPQVEAMRLMLEQAGGEIRISEIK